MNFCNKGDCTCFFDKVWKWILSPCCKLHDYNYAKQHISRFEADKRFQRCIKRRAFFLLSVFMWLGVRCFGWYWWTKAKKKSRSKTMSKTVGNAILYEDELKEHFGDESNHYLYKKGDDGTVICNMCVDFQVVADEQNIGWGNCGDALIYDIATKNITIERK